MKMHQSLRLLAVFGFFVMGLLPAAGQKQEFHSAPVQFRIYVPYEGSSGNNNVIFGPCAYLEGNTKVDVTINGGMPAQRTDWTVKVADGTPILPTPVLIPHGHAGAGRIAGYLNAYRQGNATFVTFSGTITGLYSYGYQSNIEINADQPLLVCLIAE